MACHKDAIAPFGLGRGNNRFGRREILNRQRLNGNPGILNDGLRLRKSPFGKREHALVVVIDGFRTVFIDGGVVVRLNDGQKRDFCPELFGKGCSSLDRG